MRPRSGAAPGSAVGPASALPPTTSGGGPVRPRRARNEPTRRTTPSAAATADQLRNSTRQSDEKPELKVTTFPSPLNLNSPDLAVTVPPPAGTVSVSDEKVHAMVHEQRREWQPQSDQCRGRLIRECPDTGELDRRHPRVRMRSRGVRVVREQTGQEECRARDAEQETCNANA